MSYLGTSLTDCEGRVMLGMAGLHDADYTREQIVAIGGYGRSSPHWKVACHHVFNRRWPILREGDTGHALIVYPSGLVDRCGPKILKLSLSAGRP